MDPQPPAGDDSDAVLDVMLAISGDRALAAIHGSLNLDAGLAEIIGAASGHQRPTGARELDGERAAGVPEAGRPAAGTATSGGHIRAGSPEDRYLTTGKSSNVRATGLPKDDAASRKPNATARPFP
jgi:hypothetical protein